VDRDGLLNRYRGYIDCLNRRTGCACQISSPTTHYNGETIGLSGYQKMLERNVAAFPDLAFNIDFLVADPPMVGARLLFDCAPQGDLFGLAVKRRRVAFAENVFYRFTGGKIESVWSVIDQAAIRAQLEH
jgi:predicted ester cyclase